jgi:hypothetical protein
MLCLVSIMNLCAARQRKVEKGDEKGGRRGRQTDLEFEDEDQL